MQRVRFSPVAFPAELAGRVRRRLAEEHARCPFSAVDARDTVRRVAGIAGDLGLRATVYRGALDLRGAELDHVWLDVEGRVVDAAFPLLEDRFVQLLRRFAAGEAETGELAEAAAALELDRRVIGEFPERLAYIGAPVWRALVPGSVPRST